MWKHALGIKLCQCLSVGVLLAVMSGTHISVHANGT